MADRSTPSAAAGQPVPLSPALEEVARRAVVYRWLEERLFELLGGWVTITPEPEVQLLLATHAPKHAWHAELWADRIPRVVGLDPESLAAPTTSALASVVDAAAAPRDASETVERLAGAYRGLLPRLASAYAEHLAAVDTVSGGPQARALELALADELDDWHAGEAVLQRLLVTPADAERAARQQAKVEARLVDAGGLLGPGSTLSS